MEELELAPWETEEQNSTEEQLELAPWETEGSAPDTGGLTMPDTMFDDMAAERRAEDQAFEESGRYAGPQGSPVRSHKDLYESTLNKYPERVRKEYLQSIGEQWTPDLPTLDITTGFGAFGTPLSEEESKQLEQLEKDLQVVYNNAGEEEAIGEIFGMEIPYKARFQYRTTNNPDFDPSKDESEDNPAMIRKRYYVSPPDQNTIMRMGYELLNSVVSGVGDLATGNITEEGPFSKAIPDMVPDSGAEDFAVEVTSLIVGQGVAKEGLKKTAKGVKAVSKLGQTSRIASRTRDLISPEMAGKIKSTYAQVFAQTGNAAKALKAANGLTRTAVIGLGYGLVDASIVDNDSEGLVTATIGNDTIQQLFPWADERRANDIAMMLDTPLINGTVSLFGAMARGVSEGFVKPGIGGIRNLEIFNKKLGGAFGKVPGAGISEMDAGLKTITWIDPNLEGVPIEEFVYRTTLMGQSLEAHATKNLQLASAGKQVDLDTTSAFIPALDQYFRSAYAHKKEQMGVKNFNEWISEQVDGASTRLIELKTAVSGNPTMVNKTTGNVSNVEDMIDEASGGYSPTGKLHDIQEQAGETLANSERELVERQRADTELFEQQADAAKAELDNAMATDPRVKEILKRADLEDNFGSTHPLDNELATVLPEAVYKSYKNMKTGINEAYSAVANHGSDVPADVDSFMEQLKAIPGAVDETGEIANSSLKKIAQSVEKDGSFANLWNNVNNDINKAIKKLGTDEQSRAVADGLYALKRNIKEHQIQHIMNNAEQFGPEVAELAKTANDGYIKYVNTFGATQETRQIAKLGRERLAGENRPSEVDGVAVGPGQGVEDFEIGTSTIVTDSTKGVAAGKKLNAILRAAEAGGQGAAANQALTDYYTGQVAKGIMDDMAKGTNVSPKTLRNSVKNVITTLGNLDAPIINDLKAIEARLAKLENTKNVSEEAMKEMQAQLEEVYTHSQKSAAAKFIYNYDPRYAGKAETVSNPEIVLDQIFNSPTSGNDINALLTRAKTLGPEEGEAIKDALKGSYLDYTKRNIFGWSEIGSKVEDGKVRKVYNLRNKGLEEYFDNPQNRKNMGIIFKDEPEVIAQMDETVETLKNMTLKSKKSADDLLGDVPPELNPEKGVNTVITLVWGVLNPTATRVRRFTGPASIEDLKQVKAIREATLAAMLADPRKFTSIINKSADKAQWDIAYREMSELVAQAGIKSYVTEEGEYTGKDKNPPGVQ